MHFTSEAMIVRKTAILLALICRAAWCQQAADANSAGAKAAPADLAISCRIDAEERTVQVRIMNHSARKCYFQYQPSGESAHLNYDVIITSMSGKRLPAPAPAPRNPNPKIPVATLGEIGMIPLNPKQERIESFPISALVDVPAKGGKFNVRIGRGLFAVWEDSQKLDPSQMLWCQPEDVTFPPAKAVSRTNK